jgi:hypothetical protein
VRVSARHASTHQLTPAHPASRTCARTHPPKRLRSFDGCIGVYDVDKLDKPWEAFKRVRDCGKGGLASLAYDATNNMLLAGSLDGVLRVWSVEGRCVRLPVLLAGSQAERVVPRPTHNLCIVPRSCRSPPPTQTTPACRCLDRFDGLSSQPVHVAHLPQLNVWWASGRGGRVAVLDPRAPAVITDVVAQPNQLMVRTRVRACVRAGAAAAVSAHAHARACAGGRRRHRPGIITCLHLRPPPPPQMSQEHTVLCAPPGSDLVIAGTSKRQLMVWQFNPHAAHRWVCHVSSRVPMGQELRSCLPLRCAAARRRPYAGCLRGTRTGWRACWCAPRPTARTTRPS